MLCDIFDVDLDYLLRDKHRDYNAGSPYAQYLQKWVKIFLRDGEFHGFYCVAIIEIGKEFLVFLDDKGKAGLLNISAIASISEADSRKYRELPELSNVPSEILKTLPECFGGKVCTIRFRREKGGAKQSAIPGVHIDAITDSRVTARGRDGETYTVYTLDVLFIKEE